VRVGVYGAEGARGWVACAWGVLVVPVHKPLHADSIRLAPEVKSGTTLRPAAPSAPTRPRPPVTHTHTPPRPDRCAAAPFPIADVLVPVCLPALLRQALIAKIKANTPGADDVIISTHCQNDLGLSTANSLAGAMGGARQVCVPLPSPPPPTLLQPCPS
jgi:hypothetical protein